jgi:hypothetical protein
MSYIRSLSNPEHLYIIASSSGSVEFLGEVSKRLPRHVFETIMSRWIKRYRPDKIRYKGAWIREIDEPGENQFRWEFGYKGWDAPVIMWKTTLFYIAKDICDYRREKS